MRKIYYLSSCSTCNRIIADLNLRGKKFIFQDIKSENILTSQVEDLKTKAGSYQALFSPAAKKYKSMELDKKKLVEADFKKLILEEYTFLKRPVIIIDEKIFIGNSKDTISEIKSIL